MKDQHLEDLIKSKNLTAPRITLEALNANIKHVEYVKHVTVTGKVLRWAILTVFHGYGVTGDPSCSASVANDNQQIGDSIAYENAKRNLWPLMGYTLSERLAGELEILKSIKESATLTEEDNARLQASLEMNKG